VTTLDQCGTVVELSAAKISRTIIPKNKSKKKKKITKYQQRHFHYTMWL